MTPKTMMGGVLPSLAALAGRTIKRGSIESPTEWKHVSRATLQNPPGSTKPELRDARKARRVKRMRLRARRGRGCAG